MTIERYADVIEERFAPRGRFAMLALEYQGAINEDAMEVAHTLLCHRHPVLLGRIIRDERGYLIKVTENDRPKYVVVDEDIDSLVSNVGLRWQTPPPEDEYKGRGRALSRLILARGSSSGYIVLSADHTVVDGMALTALQVELMEIYTRVCSGIVPDWEPSNRLPTPPSRILQERWAPPNWVASELIGANDSMVKGVVRVARFSRADTDKLIAESRRRQITVGGLILNELVRSVGRNSSRSAPGPIKLQTVVNLRNRVTPAVGPTETTNFVGLVSFEVPTKGDVDAIGSKFRSQVQRSIRNHDVEIPGYRRREDQPDINTSTATSIDFNNVGVVSSNIIMPPDLRLTGGLVELNFLAWEKAGQLDVLAPPSGRHIYCETITCRGEFLMVLIASRALDCVPGEIEEVIRRAIA